MTERNTLVEINGGRPIWVVTFSADGKHLISGDDEGVRVWQVADGEAIMAREIQVYDVRSIAVSRDGRQIAAGTELGKCSVWDAQTYTRVFMHRSNTASSAIKAVDFSPDSTQLLTGSSNCTASVWDLTTQKCILGPLHHHHGVVAAKYSARGDRFATACADPGFVRIYDSHSGQLLLDISISVAVYCNTGLTWSNDSQSLFIVSDGKIKRLQVSTGSIIGEWHSQYSSGYACVTLSQRGILVAWSDGTVNFWDASTGAELGQGIEHDEEVHSIALSPDDQLLATSTGNNKIIIGSLQDILPSSSGCPFIDVRGSVLVLWMQNQLGETETLLGNEIESGNASYRALAYRSLIRSRRSQWVAANDDAKESIDVQPSVIGIIAKSVALVGAGKKQDAYREFDIAFKYCHSDRVDDLLAIKAVLVFLAKDYDDGILRMGNLVATARESIYHILQAHMCILHGDLCLQRKDYDGAIRSFELAQAQCSSHPSPRLGTISLITGWQFDGIHTRVQQNHCEALRAAGRMKQVAEVVSKLVSHATNITDVPEWICGFIQRCLSTSDDRSDTTSDADSSLPQVQATITQSFVSSLDPSTSILLMEWTKIKLVNASWRDVFTVATRFSVPRIMVYRAVCEGLEATDCVTDAITCFNQMLEELAIEQNAEAEWVPNFRNCCSRKLETLGDAAAEARQHDEAVRRYSLALTLGSTPKETLLAKRSEAYIEMGSPDNALEDANDIIQLNELSPLGYERKHTALRAVHRYNDAIDAFRMMLLNASQSSDPEIRNRLGQYVRPEDTEAAISEAVRDAVRDLPRVLIGTHSGRLFNKTAQASMFEQSEVFKDLVSAMTTHMDTSRIKYEVAQYYRYATLSHTWEEPEPLFQDVAHRTVYDLEESLTHDKLRMFCEIVREAGFNWAWSDNCCINKQDHSVRDEALVAMFRWYEGAALVIVFLRGVRSPSKPGDLTESTWNTRAWTFQEYHAARVVRFYTEDWEPYLNLNNISNHKDSSEIISEMEKATGVSAEALKALQPGLDDIREKLSLASLRCATYVEDKAYSLFGIFSIALPVQYGEGDNALGRLLAHLLASSGDTSILAWTGNSGSFNSCLPADIAVYNHLPTSHIPPTPIENARDPVISPIRASSLNLAAATRLYEKLSNLHVPTMHGKRIKIPCITFKLGRPALASGIFRARADALGTVEITTADNLSQFSSLYLVHPWVDFLLDRQPVGGGEDFSVEGVDELSGSIPGPSNIPPISQRTQTFVSRFLGPRQSTLNDDVASLESPSRTSLTDTRMQIPQFLARLGQPFGPLLLTPIRRHVAEFRRVATDSSITVQIRPDVSLNDLILNVRMLDLL